MRESPVIASDNGKVNGGHGNAERQNQNSNSLEPSISIPIPNAKCKMNGIIFKHSIECMIVCRFMGNVGHFLLGCIIFNLQNVPHCEYMYKYGVKHPSNRDWNKFFSYQLDLCLCLEPVGRIPNFHSNEPWEMGEKQHAVDSIHNRIRLAYQTLIAWQMRQSNVFEFDSCIKIPYNREIHIEHNIYRVYGWCCRGRASWERHQVDNYFSGWTIINSLENVQSDNLSGQPLLITKQHSFDFCGFYGQTIIIIMLVNDWTHWMLLEFVLCSVSCHFYGNFIKATSETISIIFFFSMV